ncbi:hypothetical protein PR002_g25029 [Phytophthora rubi]|uniref:Fucosyltransferase n=1 Tax=Phytophthora rubi TaxID=129364 RepID=A0A6A3I7I8_9STRA|nr:hypothetical protein PR002_g25029 [Phytophthora rubi]
MYPADGAVETNPVEFRAETGINSMEQYKSHYGDRVLCVELTEGSKWNKCTPMLNPSIIFDKLPIGNYTARAFITDVNGGVFWYHQTSETGFSVVTEEELAAYKASVQEMARGGGKLQRDLGLLEWASQERQHWETRAVAANGESPGRVLVNNLTGNGDEVLLLIGVKAAVVENFAFRRAVRETWASENALPNDVRVLFVGCVPKFDEVESKAEQEAIKNAIELEKRMYGDLLTDELDCDDSYDDLPNKVKQFLRFAAEAFPRTPFVMIADDDIYLRADRLAGDLREIDRPRRLYIGQVWDNLLGRSQEPVRDLTERYYIPEDTYPLRNYPPFAFGPHYLLSMDCVRFIAKNYKRFRGLGPIDDRHVYLNVASSSFGERLGHSPIALLSPATTNMEQEAVDQRRFCAYLYARCDRPQREYMFDILNAMEPVDALGICAGSSRLPDTSHATSRYSDWYNDDAVTTFQSYKFVIAFENSGVPGYVTEKMVNPFLAGSIPIYLGNSTTVSELFNPNSFIDCGVFEKLRDCAKYVVKVHRSPELYAQMRREPPIRNVAAFNEAFSWHPSVPSKAMADKVAKLMQTTN